MARRVGHSSRSATAIEDTIYLRNLCLSAVVGFDAWGRPGKSQPVIMCIQLHIDTTQTGISDDLKHSFSYGQMCKDIITAIDGNEFRSILELMSRMGTAADLWPGQTITGHIVLPKAFLRVSGGLSVDFVLSKHSSSQWNLSTHELAVKGIETACIIGVNPHERLEKQTVSIDLIATMKKLFVPVERWQKLVVEASAFETLEALATLIAGTCLEVDLVPQITVAVEKPSALALAEASGVTISRIKPGADLQVFD